MCKCVRRFFQKKVAVTEFRLPKDGHPDDCNIIFFRGKLDLALGNDHFIMKLDSNIVHDDPGVVSDRSRVYFGVFQAKNRLTLLTAQNTHVGSAAAENRPEKLF